MKINIANAEEVLFQDTEAWKHIPDMTRHRDQWAFSRTSPHLRPTGRRAVLDFIVSANEGHEIALSSYFGSKVTIDKFDPSPVKNLEFRADDPPDLNCMSDYTGFGIHRDGETIKMTFWR